MGDGCILLHYKHGTLSLGEIYSLALKMYKDKLQNQYLLL